jgi:hypothetical protein
MTCGAHVHYESKTFNNTDASRTAHETSKRTMRAETSKRTMCTVLRRLLRRKLGPELQRRRRRQTPVATEKGIHRPDTDGRNRHTATTEQVYRCRATPMPGADQRRAQGPDTVSSLGREEGPAARVPEGVMLNVGGNGAIGGEGGRGSMGGARKRTKRAPRLQLNLSFAQSAYPPLRTDWKKRQPAERTMGSSTLETALPVTTSRAHSRTN